jgi:LacI family transcriptional regulator
MKEGTPERPSNIHDVARMAKVSIATVSLAMNGKGRVSPETQQRVRSVCNTLGYRPHPSARLLPRVHRGPRRRPITDLIAFNVVEHPWFHSTYPEILNGVTERVWESRKMIIYQPVEKGKETAFPWVNRYGIDGRLLVGRIDDSVMNLFRDEGVPSVIIGDHQCERPAWSVNQDHQAVGRMMVDHLWNLGHRRFLFLNSEQQFEFEKEIRKGFEERIRQKASAHAVYLVTGANDARIEPFDGIMADPATRPTAVLTMEWVCTGAVLRRAQKLGLRIPADFSLLAFAPGPRANEIGLTFVDPGLAEMGRCGMDLLRRLMEEERAGRPARTLITPAITEGKTCGPPPVRS